MLNTKSKTPIEEFLSVVSGGQDVGLLIASKQNEYEELKKNLIKFGFSQIEDITDVLKLKKAYFIIKPDTEKDIYDFISQYPSGQVQIFDKKNMKPQVFFPDYKNSSFVLLVDQDNLNKSQAKGFDFLSVVGLAYRP